MFLFRQKNMFFIKTREHENKRTLSSATISHEICQHSAHFLPTFVRIHEFGSAYVCAKDRKKHRNEWLMHVF